MVGRSLGVAQCIFPTQGAPRIKLLILFTWGICDQLLGVAWRGVAWFSMPKQDRVKWATGMAAAGVVGGAGVTSRGRV